MYDTHLLFCQLNRPRRKLRVRHVANTFASNHTRKSPGIDRSQNRIYKSMYMQNVSCRLTPLNIKLKKGAM